MFGDRVPIAPERVPSLIVRQEKNDVGPLGRFCASAAQRREKNCDESFPSHLTSTNLSDNNIGGKLREAPGQITEKLQSRCCIAGGGPAGMMLGFLLARAGVEVMVLEKHADFLRDFRGDTIHPSTLEVMYELGLLDEFLKRPHQEVAQLNAQIGDTSLTVADFSHLPTRCKFIAFMPQWEFLDFLADQGRLNPTFHLRMEAEVIDLVYEGERVISVRAKTSRGTLEVHADLVIGADGRSSTVREKAGLEILEFGAPMDVLWMRFSKGAGDPIQSLGRVEAGKVFAMIDRGDYWQCGYVIIKGSFDAIRERGLSSFREERWHRPGLLLHRRRRPCDVTHWGRRNQSCHSGRRRRGQHPGLASRAGRGPRVAACRSAKAAGAGNPADARFASVPAEPSHSRRPGGPEGPTDEAPLGISPAAPLQMAPPNPGPSHRHRLSSRTHKGQSTLIPMGELRCSFCNKAQEEVRKLLAGSSRTIEVRGLPASVTSFICDECVEVCSLIVADEGPPAPEGQLQAAGAPSPWPVTSNYFACALCRVPHPPEQSLVIPDRGVLCSTCIEAILAAVETREEDSD